MRQVRRFWFLAVGFCTAIVAYLLTPGQWLNRLLAVALCTVLTTDQVCLPQGMTGRAVAAMPQVAVAQAESGLVAQRSSEFDDVPMTPAPSNTVTPPPYPVNPGPNFPVRRPDFDDVVNRAATDAAQEMLLCNSPSYSRLLDRFISDEVKSSINQNNSKIQEVDPNKPVNYDEYSTTVRLPEGKTPGAFFQEMIKDMNSIGRGKFATDFNSLAGFPKLATMPEIGDIWNLRLGSGLINTIEHGGDVVVTDLNYQNPSNQYIEVTTIDSPVSIQQLERSGRHPVNGSREFGFEQNPNGTTRFYTRAADQWNNPLASFGSNSQSSLWQNFMKGLGERVREDGGSVIEDLSERRFSTPNFPNCQQPVNTASSTTNVSSIKNCRVNLQLPGGTNPGACVIQGPVMTAEGMVDGTSACGVCNLYFGDLPPHRGGCKTRPIDGPVTAFNLGTPVPCPGNWDSGW